MSMSEATPIVTAILAIGSVISPVFFGYLIFKLSDRFVSRIDFQDYKTLATKQRDEMNDDMHEMREDIKTLLTK